uniref:Uncharacterized protein n=1 Tax=Aegilops tauschii TaxID=37682 RepID=R7W0B4_AEGTA
MPDSYYPHGVPHGGGGGLGGQQTAKTVAIVLGGALALGFLVICLLFARSLVKKKDGTAMLLVKAKP